MLSGSAEAASPRLGWTHRLLVLLAGALAVFAIAGLAWRLPGSNAARVASAYGVDPVQERPLSLADSQVRALFVPDTRRPGGSAIPTPPTPAPALRSGAAARPAPDPVTTAAGPRIAIVLTEVGEDARVSPARLARLPAAIGIAVTPNANHSATYAAAALAAGHEVWAGIPMQPVRYPSISPGPRAVLLTASARDNQETIIWALGRVPGAVGAYNIMGSAITADVTTMGQVLAVLKERRLRFLDTRSTGATVSSRLGGKSGVPITLSDRFLDEDASPAAIDAALDALLQLARRQGQALGVMQADPATLSRLETWLPTLAKQNVTLVPTSGENTTLERD